ncbi:helix-turn-helix domain-containing protein [Flintibacter porci]|uniref:helix-turn-helix domain-containing protein n=1 Tax=Flintibacter porci TaxID=3342383 RepID=UPI003F8C5B4A
MDYHIFRENLRQLVNGSGKTIQDLAADLSMSTPTLSRYLTGKRTPDLPYVVRISEYFNISIDWLLGLNGEKFDVMPPEIQEVATLYAVATKDDRRVVQAVLGKYKEAENNGGNSNVTQPEEPAGQSGHD